MWKAIRLEEKDLSRLSACLTKALTVTQQLQVERRSVVIMPASSDRLRVHK
ncbi:hypothetical protein F443_08926 [Phytophthora nicotianae P1569]|uniref:Uncharacterized protein n=1 Tax=Phytophthora nicotianae P1569 TaxID=1317065 RepID=V9F8H9_PHYNI|nr:hypothetical protein F443_08926 [Phytophthora nicotianae P1569]